MKSDANGEKVARGKSRGGSKQPASPGWASGLRQLYNSVLDEPLPDNFADLISKLDDKRA